MLRRLRNRFAEVRMIHICLHCGWHWTEIIYVLTGSAL